MNEAKKVIRTKPPGDNGQEQKIQVLSQLVARMSLAAQLGQHYGGDRDIYEALGYELTIAYTDYLAKYERQDMARAIIDRPVKVTWQGALDIIETDDDEKTALEKAWGALEKELGLKSRFMRLDRLTGIGQYGVLLLGLNDVQKAEDFTQPVVRGNRKLLYVKPFGEGSAEIAKYETYTRSPRFGLPTVYRIEVADVEGGTTSSVLVHHTRVVHVVDETLESEVKGMPRLQVVYNRLMDLEKVIGGDAEMFWRGARPGYAGKLDEGFQLTQQMKDDLQTRLDEYEHNLRRFLLTEGMELEALTQQISDPKNHVDVQIQMISAVTGIPKRILTGSERGELSSAEDRIEWLSYVHTRREEYAEPAIVRPFVDMCIKYGILPGPKDKYTVRWRDLFALSEKERVEIGKERSEALSKYAASPMAEGIIPPEAFLQYFLGLTDDEIELISEMREAVMQEEEAVTEEEEEIIEEEIE